MAEISNEKTVKSTHIHHMGRGNQILIYLGKQFRFFINESDWKVLPMAAVIAGLVGMVIRNRLFINMEGSLIGAFALTCVAIWNGCFNSIQCVCRERAIIKREHRSGMHISAYVCAHMIYQFLLCMGQTGLTVYVLLLIGVQFPAEGFLFPFMILDVAASILLISYASDMMSLFLSSISRTTTGAMTLMPFVLIFQLVFSGGIIPLPAWSRPLCNYTISNYGVKAVAAQSGYNTLPMETVWNTLEGMRNNEIDLSVNLGQVLDMLDSETVRKRRDEVLLKSYTVGEAVEVLNSVEKNLKMREVTVLHSTTVRSLLETIRTEAAFEPLRNLKILPDGIVEGAATLGDLLKVLEESEHTQELLDRTIVEDKTLGEVLDFFHADELVAMAADERLNEPLTVGKLADFLKNNEVLQSHRDQTFTLHCTVNDVFELFGEENVRTLVKEKTSAASRNPEYDLTEENIIKNWLMLGVFILVFAMLATLALELIDKDKR